MAGDSWGALRARVCCHRRAEVTAGGAKAAAPAQGAPDPASAPPEAAKALELKERGNAHFREGRLEEALDAYSEACVLDRHNPALWLNRSIVNRQLENWEDAEQDAQIAAELDPSNAKAHYSRALALQHLGEPQKALRSCRAGLQRQPDSVPLKRLRAELEQPQRADSMAEASAAQTAPGGGSACDDATFRAEVAAKQVAVATGTCPVAQVQESELQGTRGLAQSAAYQWRGRDPGPQERESLKKMITDMFRNKYAELRTRREEADAGGTILQTDQYEQEQKLGLTISGGHRPMPRPKNVDLPADFREGVGVISLDQLAGYSVANEGRRYLISVYGKLFDVSDRPDKYGPDGPYAALTGSDLTWALFTGVDQPEMTSRLYDLFKAKDMGKDKMSGVLSWLAWYEAEYGVPVGLLEPYTREWELPAPPLEEVEDACTVM